MLNQLSDALLPMAATQREARIEAHAGVTVWATDEEIARMSTWQIQQMRRLMRCLRAKPWRDSLMRADELDGITRSHLEARGAWTKKWRELRLYWCEGVVKVRRIP